MLLFDRKRRQTIKDCKKDRHVDEKFEEEERSINRQFTRDIVNSAVSLDTRIFGEAI